MRISALNRILTLIMRLLDRKQSTVPLVAPSCCKPLESDAKGVPLPCASPETQGVSSRVLAEFFEQLRADDTLNMHSVSVLRNGHVLASASFGDWDSTVWRATFSASKSVIALAIGCLWDDGLLRLEDRVLDYFPEENSMLTRVKWRDLTVEDLLTMRSGSSFNELGAVGEADWIKRFWASSSTGKEFRYNSLNTYMLAVLVRRITGDSVCDFLRKRLFDPLGIGEVYWETCPRGIEKGGWGLYMSPCDIAKLGQLVLQRGVWQGERLLSEEWITRAVSRRMEAPAEYGDYDYGYHIWTARDGSRFLFNGMLGQNVMGFWKSGILLVTHAGNNEMFQQSHLFEIAHRTFGGEFSENLPADRVGEQELQRVLTSLHTRYPEPPRGTMIQRLFGVKLNSLPEICYSVDGAVYAANVEEAASVGLLPVSLQAVTNRYTTGISGIRLAVEENTAVLYYREGKREHRLPIGLYAPARTVLNFGGDRYLVSVKGRISSDEEERPVWLLTVYFLETPYTRHIKLTFTGDGVILEQSETPGEDFVKSLTDTAKAELAKQPVVGGAVQKLDLDYVHYKIERLFSPRVKLQKE
ncbi:MAG: serine hydrolase [Ruminococcaceae bacterium]|nr:serine hydrolase [Oscillospiraceae bacterium]